MKKRLYLVTGACGFVGSHMVELLREKGLDFRATDLHGRFSPLVTGVEDIDFIHADLTEPDELDRVTERVHTIFHIAALFDFLAPFERLNRVNVEGTRNLLDSAVKNGVKRVILLSTGGVYGVPEKDRLPITEETPLAPSNDYERSKLMQEEVAEEFHKSGRLGVTIVRPGGAIYGPRNLYGAYNLLKLLSILPYPIYIRNLKARVSFVHVKDVVNSLLFLSKKEETVGEKYIVKDDSNYTQGEFVEVISKLMGKKAIGLYLPEFLFKRAVRDAYLLSRSLVKFLKIRKSLIEPDTIRYSANDYWFSNEKIKRAGYRLLYPDLSVGMAETINWYFRRGLL